MAKPTIEEFGQLVMETVNALAKGAYGDDWQEQDEVAFTVEAIQRVITEGF